MGNKKVPKSLMIALFSKLLGINSCWQNRIEFEKKYKLIRDLSERQRI